MEKLNRICTSLTTVAVLLFAAAAYAAIPNLTGIYTAEDGGIYYVQQSGTVVCWTGMSVYSEIPATQQLRRGLTYTNVFRGSFSDDSTVTGDWVEVSRGVTLASGSLTLHVDTSQGFPILSKAGGTFRTATWNPSAAFDDTTDIFPLFDNIYKNDGGSIHDNLKPYRDATVVYARVTSDAMKFDQTVTHQPPHVNYGTDFQPPIGPIDGFLDFGKQDRSYDSFAASSDEGDGDFDFRLIISLSDLEQDFQTTGWGDLGPDPILNKFNDTVTHSTLGYTGNNAYLGAEGIMWGIPAVNNVLSLPAWAQLYNSILVNGRPIDGVLQLENPTDDCNFPQPCPYVVPGETLQDGIQIGKPQIVVGSYVRVTGTLVLDCGHSDLGNLSDPFGPCYDEDDSDNWRHQNQEIHPVSAIDIINWPLRPEDFLVSARQNLTGAWGGSDGSTYYLRQIGNTLWWLGLPRDRQPMQRGTNPLGWNYPPIQSLQLANALVADQSLIDFNANCGPGTAIDGVLLGAAYPCWAFANVFKGTITAQTDGSATIQGNWVGVPQSVSPGNVGTSQTFTVDALRKTIHPVTSIATIFPNTLLKLYEPEDTNAPSSTLTIGSPMYTSASSETFVSQTTVLTVNVSDQDSGPQNVWYRDFPQGGTVPAYTPVVGSVGSFTLSGSDGVYEVDTYGTDNAGNDEVAHNTVLYLDKTPPVATITQPSATQYGHGDSLTLNYSVSDGLGSGVSSVVPRLDGQTAAQFGASLASGQTIYLFSLPLGTHTFSLDSADNVRNAITNSVTFSITVTPQSLIEDVNAFQAFGCMDNISQSLESKTTAVQDDIAKGQLQAAVNTLAALVYEVSVQAGKHISTTCKDPNGISFDPVQILLGDAQYLENTLASQVKADPILGMVTNGSNVAIAGATVSLLNSSKTVAVTVTDVDGFYYFSSTGALSLGANYSMVVKLPKGYKSCSPALQSFTWSGNEITLGSFVLN